MSDNSEAVRVATEAILDSHLPGERHHPPTVVAAHIIAALRSSPAALADLNGGEPVASLIAKMAATIANLNTEWEANAVDAVWDACGDDGWDLTSAEVVALRAFVPHPSPAEGTGECPGKLTDKERLDRQITEAQVQRTITDALDTFGWVWHHETDSRLSKAGFPDICAVHPTTGALLFLELKTETGRIKPEQQVWLDALSKHVGAEWERCRCEAILVRPSNMDDTLGLIRRWSGR